MRMMGDSPFGGSLLQLYVSVRKGLSLLQVMVSISELCWEEMENVTWTEGKALRSLHAVGFLPFISVLAK